MQAVEQSQNKVLADVEGSLDNEGKVSHNITPDAPGLIKLVYSFITASEVHLDYQVELPVTVSNQILLSCGRWDPSTLTQKKKKKNGPTGFQVVFNLPT